MTSTEPARDALRAWVREHRVCWEQVPYFEIHAGQRVHIGFELSLFAQPGVPVDVPGDAAAYGVYERLRELVSLAIVDDPRVEVDIEPFDSSFHLRTETGGAHEVELKALVLHRRSRFAPADAAQLGVARAVESRLGALGVQPRVWSELAAARGR